MKEHYEIITQAWKFLKRNIQKLPLSDEGWQSVINEARDIAEPYAHTPLEKFARRIIVECEYELERISKEGTDARPIRTRKT